MTQSELNEILAKGYSPAESDAAVDEREADKDLQRQPYTNHGENHD